MLLETTLTTTIMYMKMDTQRINSMPKERMFNRRQADVTKEGNIQE